LRAKKGFQTDARGLPPGYTVVPTNEREYEPLADLLTGTPAEAVIADKGFWGRDSTRSAAARRARSPTYDGR
jgi:hypothetical protein